MALSTAAAGGIMLVTMIIVAMMTPGMLDTVMSVHESSYTMSSVESEIFDTRLQISSLEGSPDGNVINFTLNNVGTQKLWNFEKFDLIVTYEANVLGTRTMTVEYLVYNATGSFLNKANADELVSGHWIVDSITNDNVEKGILNSNEGGYVIAKLPNTVYSGGKIIVVMSTERGVLSSSAIQLS